MSAPLVVNTTDGTVWTLRTETRSGLPLYAIAGAPDCCPPQVMATYAELAEHGIAGEADVLPVPVGPQMPDFPPPPRTELEKLRSDVARLQGLLAEAVRDSRLARRERDLMRERVSEPYGCQHCGEAKRTHGHQWTTGVGMHAWTAPTQEQIAERMRARRTVRVALDNERLRARVDEVERAYTFDTAGLKRERDALQRRLHDAAMVKVWKNEDGKRFVFVDDLAPALLGLDGTGEQVERSADKLTRMLAPTQALRGESYEGPPRHSYRLGRDLPPVGGGQ